MGEDEPGSPSQQMITNEPKRMLRWVMEEPRPVWKGGEDHAELFLFRVCVRACLPFRPTRPCFIPPQRLNKIHIFLPGGETLPGPDLLVWAKRGR